MATSKFKTQAWGIAQVNLDGSMELVYVTVGRQDVRDRKREVYPGSDYKTVRINATFEPYRK
jgi:hypothetical protein